MTLLTQTRAELNATGVAITGDVGGIRKKKYWTPDGREIMSVPSIKHWMTVKVVNGKKVMTGEGDRDANLDKGWLLEPPQEPKLYCKGCFKWHDTQKEINKCIAKRTKSNKEWDIRARKLMDDTEKGDGQVNQEIKTMKSDIADIKLLLNKLLEKGG